MNEDESLELFGVIPNSEFIPKIRNILRKEITKGKQGKIDSELIMLCCVQLFSKRSYEDILLIWEAKQVSFDTAISIEIQLLCSNGIDNTKKYLRELSTNLSDEIIKSIESSEKYEDFMGFSYETQMEYYIDYYSE